MESAGWYRVMARDCMRLAQAARTPQLRLQLLDQAWTWWRLAEEPGACGEVALTPGDRGDVDVAAGEAVDRRRRHA